MIMVLLFGHHGHVQLPEFRSYGARGRTVIAGDVAMAIKVKAESGGLVLSHSYNKSLSTERQIIIRIISVMFRL